MYYRKAIKLQAFFDMAEDDGEFTASYMIKWTHISMPNSSTRIVSLWSATCSDHIDIFEDDNLFGRIHDGKNGPHSLSAQLDALADIKFTYVISCQLFGELKSSRDSRAQDVIDLMIR